jgi:hypothetical protein
VVPRRWPFGGMARARQRRIPSGEIVRGALINDRCEMEDIMHAYKFFAGTLVTAAFAFSVNDAGAQEFSARLDGFNELGELNNETGAILSDGSGTVSLQLNEKTGAIA